ncbi:hypothetical protein HpBGD52_01480 [Helicobacter pylori]|nr:hypothetical protein KVE71_00315 [Helicobacter pylori]
MIEINVLLQKLDDALDKIVHKKEPESFLKPIVSEIEDYQKECQENSSAIHRRAAIQ